jgi:hypothetical protein
MRKIILALVALGLGAATPASAASLLEKNFWLSGPNYDGYLPSCDDPAVSAKIAARFARKESEYWHSDLTLDHFDRYEQIGFRPWGESFIPRRFCTARVLTSDGIYRTVSFAVAEDLGIIGVGWGVEWCVSGLDRNLAYAPACKMARP